MNTELFFDFTVDKATNTIYIKREFDAALSLVWDAFTKQEILDLWGAPAPWKARTRHMEFKVGGRRHYAMVNEEGQEFWSVQDFTSITPMSNLQYLSGFTDKDENINPEFYGSRNNLDFSEHNGITTLSMSIQYTSSDILQMMVEKGFREGFTASLENLEKWLAGASKK